MASRQIWRVCLIQRPKFALFFGVFERRKVDKNQTYMKTETCSILESFEYFCQMSSK